jgi:hypothetical protein
MSNTPRPPGELPPWPLSGPVPSVAVQYPDLGSLNDCAVSQVLVIVVVVVVVIASAVVVVVVLTWPVINGILPSVTVVNVVVVPIV